MAGPQIPVSAQELFLGQTVQTQRQGDLELTLSGAHQRMTGDQRFNELKARAEVGVTDRLQLQAELPYQIDDRPGSYTAQSNVGNVQVGAMYSVLRGDAPVSMTAAMDVQIPVGHQASISVPGDSRSSDQTLFKPMLIVAKDLGPTQVHTDLQAELGDVNRALNYDIGAVLPLGAVTPTLEFSGRTRENTQPQFYVTPGAYYNFSDRTQLGVAVPIGANSQSIPTQIMAKMNVRF